MSGPGLYEKVLGAVAAGAALPRARIKASASVVPWRRRGDALEVFWVERSPELAFMGGWFAFPGGGRSRADAEVEMNGAPTGADLGPPDGGMPAGVLAGIELESVLAGGIAATALRELFEETGVLPLRSAAPGFDREADRHRLLAGETAFPALVAAHRLDLDLERLVYAGRWLTPPLGPVRFDNRFFLLEWPVDEAPQPRVVPGELASGEWIEPGEARRRWREEGILAAPPILHFLRVLEEEGLPGGLERLRSPVETNLGPHRRIEFRPHVLLFPLPTPTLPPAAHTNAYVVGRERAVLVDPGAPDPAVIDGLVAAIRRLESSPEGPRVTEIWLTHHHPDHVGGVERARSRLGLPVCAHRLTGERLAARGIALDRELADGERLRHGPGPEDLLRVVHTPGHARGHLVFLEESGGSLVAGDLVAGIGTIVIDPPEGDMTDYLASLEKAAALAPTTLFPAHGPTIRDARGKLAEYARHRAWREDRIEDAWRDGIHETGPLLDRVYDDVEPIARPLAARQLEAHLIRLRALGRIDGGDA